MDGSIFQITLVVLLLFVFGLPLGMSIYGSLQRERRTRLERSNRPIKINTTSQVPPKNETKKCPHRRSASRARKGADGLITSICKWCGQPMKRNGPDDWEAIDVSANRP